MDQDNTAVETELTEESQPVESESARYLRIRRADKAEAAVTMAKNAEEAEAAKRKAQAKPFEVEGLKAFNKAAAEVEKRLNAPKEDS